MKTRKTFYFLAILCVLFCLLPVQILADTLEVGHSGYPYTSIQAAIDAAINGDTVLVHDGTYVENISISGKTITVLSNNGPGDTIIDGNGSGHVVYLGSGNSTLEGFTIQNGASQNIGGGIYCFISSPTINNCTIADNIAAHSGGGIYCSSSSPAITDCRILRNAAGNGGGIFCTGSSSPTITHCIIDGNSASGGRLSDMEVEFIVKMMPPQRSVIPLYQIIVLKVTPRGRTLDGVAGFTVWRTAPLPSPTRSYQGILRSILVAFLRAKVEESIAMPYFP